MVGFKYTILISYRLLSISSVHYLLYHILIFLIYLKILSRSERSIRSIYRFVIKQF
ncbi:hypothetical protein FA15DRAFT_414673 [Coprinopsis marcescibilis]|uniref:Uncharacterized protein n=1 Tax=Coprinopsis marcescibilis TaxID=230819 RepID=A0A5C3KAI6_COPMA|nr:hypothetical protein FA15DRAFT_414673 [Coprinopsis marcescibilis]